MPRRHHAAHPGTKLFVGNMNPQTNFEKLAEVASQFGDVEEAVVLDRLSARGQRCGFIRFVNPYSAKVAKAALEGSTLLGDDPLMVRHADKPVRRDSENCKQESPSEQQSFTPLTVADPYSPLGLTPLTPPEEYESSCSESDPDSDSSGALEFGGEMASRMMGHHHSSTTYRRDPYSFRGYEIVL